MLNFQTIVSVALGVLTGLLPNLYFAWRFFSRRHQKTPGQIVASLYKGEIVKLMIIVLLALIAIKGLSLSWGAFLIGLIGMQCMASVVLFVVLNKVRVFQHGN